MIIFCLSSCSWLLVVQKLLESSRWLKGARFKFWTLESPHMLKKHKIFRTCQLFQNNRKKFHKKIKKMFSASRIALRRSLTAFQRLSLARSLPVNPQPNRLCTTTNKIEIGQLEKKFNLFYTCKKCSTRNSHVISKQACKLI